ncbi:hypothetical protein NMY22_g18768 [Coprinellus aureogranulatus]|nr:hypothetical protein NMY22_g18768 [Coprinellus aureogranulatus]
MECDVVTGSPRREGLVPEPLTPRPPPPAQPRFTTPGHYRPDSYAPSPLKKKTYYRAQTRLQSPLPPKPITKSAPAATVTGSLPTTAALPIPAPPSSTPRNSNPYMALVGSSPWTASPWSMQATSHAVPTSSLSTEWPPLSASAAPSATPSHRFVHPANPIYLAFRMYTHILVVVMGQMALPGIVEYSPVMKPHIVWVLCLLSDGIAHCWIEGRQAFELFEFPDPDACARHHHIDDSRCSLRPKFSTLLVFGLNRDVVLGIALVNALLLHLFNQYTHVFLERSFFVLAAAVRVTEEGCDNMRNLAQELHAC